MDNSSQPFILSAYGKIGKIKYFYFTVIIVLYVAIIFLNSFLIGIIVKHKNLHEPMYLFMCNLFVNELYGSIALYPQMLVNMLLDVHEISRIQCFTQIFCLHTYGSVELSNLTVMAYDRYVYICFPLQYHKIMTPTKVYMLIIFIWLYTFSKFSGVLILSANLQLCGNIINKVYCDNYSIVKLACKKPIVNDIYGYVSIIVSIFIPYFLIFYSYAEIIMISWRSSRESQMKALNTCTPHLASLTNFSVGCLFEILQSRFDMTHVPNVVRVFISVYFLMMCPIFSPVIYGIKTAKIREAFIKMLCSKS